MMARIDFYHLQRSRLEEALPRLLTRVLQTGKRAMVVAGSEERVEDLVQSLWNDRDGWLPHGSRRDGYAEEQPVWLTEDPQDNANGAGYLFLCDGSDSVLAGGMERVFDLFNGLDDASVAQARERWRQRREEGHELRYWQQSDDGRWVEKASANAGV